jgi:hypothetical protein
MSPAPCMSSRLQPGPVPPHGCTTPSPSARCFRRGWPTDSVGHRTAAHARSTGTTTTHQDRSSPSHVPQLADQETTFLTPGCSYRRCLATRITTGHRPPDREWLAPYSAIADGLEVAAAAGPPKNYRNSCISMHGRIPRPHRGPRRRYRKSARISLVGQTENMNAATTRSSTVIPIP